MNKVKKRDDFLNLKQLVHQDQVAQKQEKAAKIQMRIDEAKKKANRDKRRAYA